MEVGKDICGMQFFHKKWLKLQGKKGNQSSDIWILRGK